MLTRFPDLNTFVTMKNEGLLAYLGLISFHLLYLLVECHNQECDHVLWDDLLNGKGVKRVAFDCTAGQVVWHSPYGGMFMAVKGPEQEHEFCLQVYSSRVSALISRIPVDPKSLPQKLLTIKEYKGADAPPKHNVCFLTSGSTTIFIEPDVSALMSSFISIEYDIETNPLYGDDACRPCTDEELLYYYCTSDFVAVGRMLDLKKTSASTMISVSLDKIKQSSKDFVKNKQQPKKLTTQLYSPPQCQMEFGKGKFVLMGKMKFGKSYLKCAPTYDDFLELQRLSKLKGFLRCT